MTNKNLAILFDMDGVVVDNIPYHKQAWKKFMTKYGFVYSNKYFDKYINGQTGKEILTKLFGENISATEIKKYINIKQDLYYKSYLPHIKPLPGLLKFLKKLQTNNIPIALATAASQENMDFVLKKTKTKKYFSIVVNANDVKNGKPHPEIFLKAAKKLHTKPVDCVVFEDSILGVKAGKRAKMKVIGVLTSNTKQELHRADRFIKDFEGFDIDDIQN